jgi:regulatory protein
MLITEVNVQKKHPDRVSVYIDDKFAFGMSQVDALFYHIKEGAEITSERYEEILNELIYAKARDKAVRLLGFSARTEKELLQKLSADYSKEISSRVIEMLKGYGYIDDTAYAIAYTKDCFNLKSWGRQKIKAELKRKGVNDEIIANVFECLDFDESDNAYELLKKRLRGNTILDRNEKAKQYRYLLSKGFTSDVINTAFNRLNNDLSNNWSNYDE